MATSNQSPPECLRCGTCCQDGGPALHHEDLALLADGVLAREHLYTLRQGEPAMDNVAGRLVNLEAEIVKIAGRSGRHACRFHQPAQQACSIHTNRPAQCRALNCRDTAAIRALYQVRRIAREDVVQTSGALWQIILLHQRNFPAALAAKLARNARSADKAALAELKDLALREREFRYAFAHKFGNPPEMDFLFGRSLFRVVSPFGLEGLDAGPD